LVKFQILLIVCLDPHLKTTTTAKPLSNV